MRVARLADGNDERPAGRHARAGRHPDVGSHQRLTQGTVILTKRIGNEAALRQALFLLSNPEVGAETGVVLDRAEGNQRRFAVT